MPKVIGNLKELIGDAAADYISLNREEFKSTVPGPQGEQGETGENGIGIHHLKGTSTTDSEGDFHTGGENDTYTFYGDSGETLNLGHFVVHNGKDAYQYAVSAGYLGTEVQFYADLGILTTTTDIVTSAAAQVASDKMEVETNTLQVAADAEQVALDRIVVSDAKDVIVASANEVQQISLGEKTSDPVVDNFGNPLQVGTMYYNSVSGTLRVWNGTEWSLGAFSVAGAVVRVNGRDGAVELTKNDVGLSNVDNTSDVNKPISTLTQTALNGKVDKIAGKGLSDENYTLDEKTKLAGIEIGATADQTAEEIKSLYEGTTDKVLNDVNVIRLSTDAGVATDAGDIAWNAEEMTVDIALGNGVVLQVGEEMLTTVENGSGSVIPNGTVVMRIGSPGNSGKLVVQPYDGVSPGYTVVGVATSDIATLGKVTSYGRLRGINTSAWVKDTILYVNGSGFTSTVPTSGIQMMVATVLTQHATNGVLLVRLGGYIQTEEW